jgi:hypothetical protein
MFVTSRLHVIQDQKKKEKKNTFIQQRQKKYTYIYVYIFYTVYFNLLVFNNIQQNKHFFFVFNLSIYKIYIYTWVLYHCKQTSTHSQKKKTKKIVYYYIYIFCSFIEFNYDEFLPFV